MEIMLETSSSMAGQLLPGSGKVVGDAIVADQRVRKVTFTGSAAVGRTIFAQELESKKSLSNWAIVHR